jgi:very-short-patch-repair endonuclease
MNLADLLAVLPEHRRAGVRAAFDAEAARTADALKAALRASRGGQDARRERRTREREGREARRAAVRSVRERDQQDFARACLRAGLPQPVPELRFHPTRGWRFDFAWPESRVALEVDGAIGWGRHTRPGGWHKDTEKLNAAVAQGWRVLRCTPDTREAAETFAAIRAALTITPTEPT